MSYLCRLSEVNIQFALFIILLLVAFRGREVEAMLPDANEKGPIIHSTYVCRADSEPVYATTCLVGCKRGDRVDTFPHDQRSRYDGCNTCSTQVYRYPDSTTCEGQEICTQKACLPISSILPGPQDTHIHDDE